MHWISFMAQKRSFEEFLFVYFFLKSYETSTTCPRLALPFLTHSFKEGKGWRSGVGNTAHLCGTEHRGCSYWEKLLSIKPGPYFNSLRGKVTLFMFNLMLRKKVGRRRVIYKKAWGSVERGSRGEEVGTCRCSWVRPDIEWAGHEVTEQWPFTGPGWGGQKGPSPTDPFETAF